ncbi:N-acetylmuramoyl-L-alanine amidase [Dermabacter hominis]|uniref:peptidoglycan recognition protein family protein n=1 Tax=Dermabacter hominis TaxID=36740 RepID=UPI0021A6FDB3|nr:N-acetylmuramoyl-L-alanine amidase [Dermabacter hominis]MCT2056835.1 N-acetylmuramoyl-L-alanine amidase [Dermabacter hominis]MCT2084324.1 N-acetylmuramoyl-L-alanine amidase [Dermabacter hominis]MCT2091977.1 N-acetylmuramoyl-L-alanine amidase [Dermabacter hominis]MCT2190180.1 N-acetylmuramoyl-L-alanine amidase [Dermabacter hominis]MCT2227877.1 N-acetylmuramoyl-L-alanine amidase [Dermabacter hominis]
MALAINTSRTSPNRSKRRSNVRRIVIHHWDDPKRKPSLDGVLSWLTNSRSKVSAHYVVSERQVYRLVPESMAAWHARGGNSDSIGIECDPRQQDETYETVAALIREIRSRHGDIPLVRHRDVKGSSTTCPGTYDLARLDRLARGKSAPAAGGKGMAKPVVKPAPKPAAKPACVKAPAFPLPNGYYYGPPSGPVRSVSGRTRNSHLPNDVIQVNGRWRSKGLAVWQARMQARGWNIGKDGADGRYGNDTERVVRQFQKNKGLAVDGKIGPATWRAAFELPVK